MKNMNKVNEAKIIKLQSQEQTEDLMRYVCNNSEYMKQNNIVSIQTFNMGSYYATKLVIEERMYKSEIDAIEEQGFELCSFGHGYPHNTLITAIFQSEKETA